MSITSDLQSFTSAELREELNRRSEEGEISNRNAALVVARDLLLSAAGFTCIHDRGPDHPMKWNPYCSECPVSPIGGLPGGYLERKLICGRVTNYPK